MLDSKVLITVDELAGRIGSTAPPVVLDVRWTLGGPPGKAMYLEGHVPGAVYVDLDTELAAPPEPKEGRHPLPDVGLFQEALRRWGVNEGDTVVAYDGNGNMSAARLWWLLKWAGAPDARLLDGGLRAWTDAGHELATDDVVPTPGEAWVRAGSYPVLTMKDAEAFDGVLVDARAAERYRGETEPVDPKAGHIPGAVNAPTDGNIDDTGRFLPAEKLRERFTDLGITDDTTVGAYCGSGITAAHEIAALEIAGFKAALFAGSWSQWSNHDLPVETDAENDADTDTDGATDASTDEKEPQAVRKET